MAKFIKLNPNDNVAVCLEAASKAQIVEIAHQQLVLVNDIPVGHKVALRPVEPGADVVKYGSPIGHAVVHILIGEHVHTHNLKTNLSGTVAYSFSQKAERNPLCQARFDFQWFSPQQWKCRYPQRTLDSANGWLC